jgi:hypothetical protein
VVPKLVNTPNPPKRARSHLTYMWCCFLPTEPHAEDAMPVFLAKVADVGAGSIRDEPL